MGKRVEGAGSMNTAFRVLVMCLVFSVVDSVRWILPLLWPTRKSSQKPVASALYGSPPHVRKSYSGTDDREQKEIGLLVKHYLVRSMFPLSLFVANGCVETLPLLPALPTHGRLG